MLKKPLSVLELNLCVRANLMTVLKKLLNHLLALFGSSSSTQPVSPLVPSSNTTQNNMPTPTRQMSTNEKIFFGRWHACQVEADKMAEIKSICSTILNNEARYKAVANPIGVPFWVVGLIHYRETSLDFTRHLHNGDPLLARTVHVPVGRPVNGSPPFTWEESARDALSITGWDQKKSWDVVQTLVRLEMYNGWAYFKMGKPSPYIWSFTDQYVSGKFAADGKFNPALIDAQPGCAALMVGLKIYYGIDLNEIYPS